MRFFFAALLCLLTSGPPASAQAARPLGANEFDCLVDAHSRVKVSAAVPGLIQKVHVDRGDRVKAGQLLVELEANVERAQIAIARSRARNDQPIQAARARVRFTAQAADRVQRLRAANPGAVTAMQFDDAITQAEIASFNLRDAELTLEAAALEAERAESLLRQKLITSPIDGVVVERSMVAGEYRNEQSSFMTLAKIDPLHVEVYLPIMYFGQTPPGSVAEIIIDAPLNSRHEAVVSVVDRVLDTASGTFGVRLTLPNPDQTIPAGLRCRLRFK
jgi:RND family efflux transporter MFP subunit